MVNLENSSPQTALTRETGEKRGESNLTLPGSSNTCILLRMASLALVARVAVQLQVLQCMYGRNGLGTCPVPSHAR